MEIIENKALLFITKKAQQITSLIPKSRIVETNGDKSKILVNWSMDEVQLLRNLGIKNVPSPILGKYNWPGVYTPFDHQRATADFLTLHNRCYVFSEAGTGKTSAAAWAADYLMTQGKIKRVLIVCPVSIMDTAWRADLFRTAMHRTVAIAQGSKRQREAVISGNYEFVIINFDGVKVVTDELAAGNFDLVIIDEANAVKSVSTGRWKALNSILKPATRLWLMTGTPAAQSPEDAYGLAKLLDPSSVPRFFGAWRDKVMLKITQFKWVPKHNAQQIVFDALQPAVRFTKAECLDLPDLLYSDRDAPLTVQQHKYYEAIRKQMIATAAGEEITAVNAASMINKLLQISCICYDTPVLTQFGWMPICNVTSDDQIWDGEDWVQCSGSVFKGMRSTVVLDGVTLTPEHLVLTNSGWNSAGECLNGESSERLTRANVRVPDSSSEGRDIYWKNQESNVALPMRLRGRSGTGISELTLGSSTQCKTLRMPSWGAPSNARDVKQSPAPHLGQHEAAVQQSQRQGLSKLWWSWHISVQSMGTLVREFLVRYAARVRQASNIGSYRCQQRVQSGKLPVGNCGGTREQQTMQPYVGYPQRPHDFGSSGGDLRDKEGNFMGTTDTLRLAAAQSANDFGKKAVYDLVNCGPRNRFVVRGVDGQLMVVHNCGAVYTDTHEVINFDVSNRLNELLSVIEETKHKVIVFVPFRHSLDMLMDEMAKRSITADCIHGGVSGSQRAEIIKRFQTEDDPKILLLQPMAAAHGITLTRADQVVWWGPTSSAEIYIQANARAHRAGQTNKVTVTHLQGSPVEKRMYAMLQGKVDSHQTLVDLYKQELLDNVS